MQKDLKEKIFKVLLVGALAIMPLFPYKVFADDYTSSTVVGFDVTYVDTVFDNQNTPNYIYEVRITLDDSYVGYLNISGTVSYNNGQSQTLTLSSTNRFVNGNQIVFRFYIIGVRYTTADYRPSLSSVQLTYGNHNLTKHSDIQSLDQIINILNDLYNNTDGIEGLLSNQLIQLQNIVINTSNLASYLDTLTKLRQFNFPFESFTAIYPSLSQNDVYEFQNLYSFSYPVFVADTSKYVFESLYTNDSYYDTQIIIAINGTISSINEISNYFDFSSDALLYDFKYYNRITYNYGNNYFYIVGWKTHYNSSLGWVRYLPKSNFKYIPIFYSQLQNVNNISTDFALLWGLSNRLLDDLHIIAQGTAASSSSSNDLEDSADDIVQNSSTMFQFENQQNTNMNNALQSINTNFDIGNISSSFLSSAAWVKTQFDNLTNTTPFGSVLSFSLLLGLALLIIGKVYK